ncbi:MAG: hypothetical protein IJW82_01175 [Clostridia bacterium]|nr:hypothetical protein [Clostridia bacterium]
MKNNKFFKFLLQPPVWFITLSLLLSVVVIAVTLVIVFSFRENELPIYSYVLFALAFLLLSYSVFLCIKYGVKFKNATIDLLKKYKFTKAVLENWGFRASIGVIASFTINVMYSIFEGVVAIMSSSIWFGALALYYLCLSVMRFSVIKNNKIKLEYSLENQDNIQKSWKIYRNSGIVLIILSFAISSAVVQMVIDNRHFEYGEIMAIVMATYCFYKISISIYNLIKAKKFDNPMMQTIKNIGFADSLMSILSLQTALIATFSEGANLNFMNGITGGVVCLLTIALAIMMIINGNKNLSKRKNTYEK